MISIELIFPSKSKKLVMRVGESTSVGEFRRYLRKFFNVSNNCIFMLTPKENVTDGMSLTEAGMFMGSGVIIENELY